MAWLRVLLSFAVILLFHAPQAAKASNAALEHQIKAACVLNAARFVYWPAAAFESDSSPLVVGVVGFHPLTATLELILRGEKIQGRPLVLKRMSADQDLGGVHILFISRSERERARQILSRTSRGNVLTMSDLEGFAGSGGILGLKIVNGQIRFEANPAAARDANIRIAPQLLKLSRIVQ